MAARCRAAAVAATAQCELQTRGICTFLSRVQVESTWPHVAEPLPSPPLHGDGAWTQVLDLSMQGWSLSDVLTIFEDEDGFTRDWHTHVNDTCAAFCFLFAWLPSFFHL